MNEFEFIRYIKRRLKVGRKEVLIGIGDDCALVNSDQNLLITVDSQVEDIHFRKRWGYPYQLGKKLVRINVSDIYAKGGEPVAAFLSIGIRYNKEDDRRFISKYISGIIDELTELNIELAGGNVSATKNNMFFDMTVIGKVIKQNLRRRNGASAGDLIAISGQIGDSLAGLMILENALYERDNFLIKRFLLPDIMDFSKKRIWRYVTSSIDISDGLYGDISHLLENSDYGATVYADKIPHSNQLINFCKKYKKDIYRFSIGGGEDYRLILTLRPDTPLTLIKRARLHIIGKIIKRKGIKIIGTKRSYNSFKHF